MAQDEKSRDQDPEATQAPGAELTEEQLENVAGGASGIHVLLCDGSVRTLQKVQGLLHNS